MKRLLLLAFSYTFALLPLTGCEPDTNEIALLGARTSSCNTCHSNPGTEACREDFVSVNGTRTTRCYRCHSQSITLDSALLESDGVRIYSYFDALDTTLPEPKPILSSAHANGTIDLDPGACDVCHEFPPMQRERNDIFDPNKVAMIKGHQEHLQKPGLSCFHCHVNSVRHQADSSQLDSVKYSAVTYNIAAKTLYAVDSVAHRNGVVDVDFLRKPKEYTDTGYIWNPLTRSCSNIGCHTRQQSYDRTYWQ